MTSWCTSRASPKSRTRLRFETGKAAAVLPPIDWAAADSGDPEFSLGPTKPIAATGISRIVSATNEAPEAQHVKTSVSIWIVRYIRKRGGRLNASLCALGWFANRRNPSAATCPRTAGKPNQMSMLFENLVGYIRRTSRCGRAENETASKAIYKRPIELNSPSHSQLLQLHVPEPDGVPVVLKPEVAAAGEVFQGRLELILGAVGIFISRLPVIDVRFDNGLAVESHGDLGAVGSQRHGVPLAVGLAGRFGGSLRTVE